MHRFEHIRSHRLESAARAGHDYCRPSLRLLEGADAEYRSALDLQLWGHAVVFHAILADIVFGAFRSGGPTGDLSPVKWRKGWASSDRQ